MIHINFIEQVRQSKRTPKEVQVEGKKYDLIEREQLHTHLSIGYLLCLSECADVLFQLVHFNFMSRQYLSRQASAYPSNLKSCPMYHHLYCIFAEQSFGWLTNVIDVSNTKKNKYA